MMHVEGVVAGLQDARGRFTERSGGVSLIEHVAVLQTEVHHEGLGFPRRDSGRIEQIHVSDVAVSDPDAAHRKIIARPLPDQVSDSEKGIGRKTVSGYRVLGPGGLDGRCQQEGRKGRKQYLCLLYHTVFCACEMQR